MRPTLIGLMMCHLPMSAMAADVNFCWLGANGYSMTGRMQYPDAKQYQAVLTEDDLTRFKIAGYLSGQLIGTWDMAQATPDTTWHLRFDPMGMTFLTGGSFAGTHSQGWNANGDVTDCGNPGFGFNSGNYAQDVCVNGVYVAASSIEPATPFIATLNPVTPDCRGVTMTSKMPILESGD